MARRHTFRNERGNQIELEIRAAEREDEMTVILAGPNSTSESTITELEAYRLGHALLGAWHARHWYRRMIGPLRAKAKDLGYAIGVHGSVSRDIDLIAAPWSDEASTARELAEALQAVAAEIAGEAVDISAKGADKPDHFHNGMPGSKPHGRLTWSFHLPSGPYIDLSVMPRMAAE